MIEIKALSKSYGNKVVIENMNFEFKTGTIFGLIGINGAGKSTLLKLLSGVLIPDSGKVLIDGIDPSIDETIKANLFYLSDDPIYTVHMCIDDLRRLYETFYEFNNKTYLDILNIFNLDGKQILSKLSKGMRRQAFIALAFATNTKYLLFDEVFDGLDPKARLVFKRYMIENQREDQIIIITSHSLRELEDICDSFGIIDQGTFKHFGQIDSYMDKIKKLQIILNDAKNAVLKAGFNTIYSKQEGRVLNIIYDSSQYDIDEYIIKDNCLAIDELSMTFEEYFIVTQEGGNKHV